MLLHPTRCRMGPHYVELSGPKSQQCPAWEAFICGKNLAFITALICQGCCSKGPQTRWPTGKECIVHFWRLLLFSCSVVSDSLCPNGLQPARLLCPWHSPSKNTGVGCHALLQGTFPTQGSNLCLLYQQANSLLLRLEVFNQGVSRVDYLLRAVREGCVPGLSPWVVGGCFLHISLHMAFFLCIYLRVQISPSWHNFFWLPHMAFRILVPPSGIKPMPPTFGILSLNHWMAQEAPNCPFLTEHQSYWIKGPLYSSMTSS